MTDCPEDEDEDEDAYYQARLSAVARKYEGQALTDVTISPNGKALRLTFPSGVLVITDNGDCCCGLRYMHTQDELREGSKVTP